MIDMWWRFLLVGHIQGYRVGYNASTYVYGNSSRTQTLSPTHLLISILDIIFRFPICLVFLILQNIRDKIDLQSYSTPSPCIETSLMVIQEKHLIVILVIGKQLEHQ